MASTRLSYGRRKFRHRPGILLLAILSAALQGHAIQATAQAYPSRPIRMIIPFPPGGSNDILGRFLAQKMSERLGEQVLPDNRAGADGIIGAHLASQSTPDGHTILVVSTSYTQNPAIHKMPFDPARALVAISQIGYGPIAFYTAPNSALNGIKDLIAAARSREGAVRYATSGVGGVQHFSGELFNSMAGIRMVHVPYKGGGPSMVDVMSGRVEIGLGTVIQALPLIRSGKLRAIAVTTPTRSATLPDVPTISESGLAGYESGVYWGVMGPAGIPRSIIERLNREIGIVLKDPDSVKRLQADAAEPVAGSPEAFQKLIHDDLRKWARIAKETGIQAE